MTNRLIGYNFIINHVTRIVKVYKPMFCGAENSNDILYRITCTASWEICKFMLIRDQKSKILL